MYVKQGKFTDIGTHEELASRHKTYTKVLSLKDEEPIDLDSQDVVRKDSIRRNEERPISPPFSPRQRTRTTSFQQHPFDDTKLASLHNSLAELGTFSTEMLNSLPSIRSFATCRDEYDETDSDIKEAIPDVKFSSGLKQFIKVHFFTNVYPVYVCINNILNL